MHPHRPHPKASEIAASGLVVGGGIAAARMLSSTVVRRGLAAGTILQRRLLGTEARYRVLSAAPRTVDVEVLAAPGLEPGLRMRLTVAAARAAALTPRVSHQRIA
jgi:hypothetical protein